MKTYVPVGNVERQSSHCPTYLSWIVLYEVRDYCRRPIPETYADDLARRAEAVFIKHKDWQSAVKGRAGRETLLSFIQHWLSAVLAKEKPALFRELPEEFTLGCPLPPHRPAQVKRRHQLARIFRPTTRLAHGCDLLAV